MLQGVRVVRNVVALGLDFVPGRGVVFLLTEDENTVKMCLGNIKSAPILSQFKMRTW